MEDDAREVAALCLAVELHHLGDVAVAVSQIVANGRDDAARAGTGDLQQEGSYPSAHPVLTGLQSDIEDFP